MDSNQSKFKTLIQHHIISLMNQKYVQAKT